MNENKNEGCACCCAVILALLMIACMLCGCKTKYITQTEYKEVPVVMHDTIISEKWSHDTLTRIIEIVDTVMQHDSIVVYTDSSGVVHQDRYTDKRSVRSKKEKEKDSSNNGEANVKVIEKPVLCTTEKIVPEIRYEQTWWQKIFSCIGAIVFLFGLVWVLTKIKK